MSANLLISTHFLGKSYGAQPLFSDVSLQVFDNERLGLIGPNGAGKSTLLKILAGLETVDSGEVRRKKNARVVYLPQEDDLDPQATVEETLRGALDGDLEPWRAAKRLLEIKGRIGIDDAHVKAATLSGGWRKKVAIGRALVQRPDLLLMDEPTNHLDLEGILWLETLLKQAPFAFALVSHDRFFLENTTHRIAELDRRYPEGFFKVEGNYSTFIERRERYAQQQAKLETVLSSKVRREIEWLRRGPKARASKAQYRIDQAHRLQADLASVRERNARDRSVDIAFEATGRRTRILLEARKIGKSLGGRRLFDALSLNLTPGSCLGILGRNGTGKTTLIHTLAGRLRPDSGTVKTAEGLRVVTFDQHREIAGADRSLRRVLSPEGDTLVYRGRPVHVTAWAKRFLFRPEQLGMPVSGLSGGEKARVRIADLMRRPADLLLLDEPTNDLDIPTLEVLEEGLAEFAGAMVLITHDRFLMDRLCDRLLHLDGDGNARFFADYHQWRQSAVARTAGEPRKAAATRTAAVPNPGKLAYEERKALGRIERQIEKAEALADDLDRRLHDPEIQSDAVRLAEIYAEHQQALETVDRLYRRWEELEGGSPTIQK